MLNKHKGIKWSDGDFFFVLDFYVEYRAVFFISFDGK